jgi:cytochrome c oxidase subunit 2
MNTGIDLLPPQASTFAADYDMLFWYVTLVICTGGGLVYLMVAYFCFAFAQGGPTPRQTPRILGSTKLEVAWTLIPLLLFLTFFVWGVKLYNEQLYPPADAPEYFAVGKQWMWKLQHPTGQREINELHLPVASDDEIRKGVGGVRLTGTSEDVIHDFGVPAFRSKIDVVPGRYTTTWYRPTTPGKYHIFCDQYCGQGHSQMVGTLFVLTKAEYEAWLEGTYKDYDAKNSADGSPAWEGAKLFRKLQCVTCHNPEASGRAPRLEAIYNQMRPIQGGAMVKADDAYLRESIRNPMAKVVDGWKPIMPAYPRSQVSEEELLNVVTYIKSLKPGNLPNRLDQFPAPVGAPGAPTSEGGLSK